MASVTVSLYHTRHMQVAMNRFPSAWFRRLAHFPQRHPTPTTCLHGLRGLAACAVFLRHLLVSFFDFPDHGSTHPETSPVRQLLRSFPILLLPYGGNAMVAVFFAISGYLDSAKPLQLIQSQDWAYLQGHMASSILRRAPRLFLPALAAATLTAVAVWLGLHDWGMQYRRTFFAGPPRHLARETNPVKQLWVMGTSFSELFNLWEFGPVLPKVNMHYWTLPYDLRATFIRYLTILASSRLNATGRFGVMAAVVGFCAAWGRWEVVLNLCGALLYQVDLSRGWLAAGEKRATRRARWVYVLLLIASLYLCCFPKENGQQTPGFRWLSWLTPTSWQDCRWWNCWAALVLVWVVLHHPGISRFLEGPVPQYFGNISFSMYLLHGPVLHMTAYAFVPMVWSWGVLGQTMGFLVPVVVVVIPSAVLAADLFSRTVESQIGQLIRRVESACAETA